MLFLEDRGEGIRLHIDRFHPFSIDKAFTGSNQCPSLSLQTFYKVVYRFKKALFCNLHVVYSIPATFIYMLFTFVHCRGSYYRGVSRPGFRAENSYARWSTYKYCKPSRCLYQARWYPCYSGICTTWEFTKVFTRQARCL